MWPPLHAAAWWNNPKAIRVLVTEFGFCPDSYSESGKLKLATTPLFLAVQGDKGACYKALLELGANPLNVGRDSGREWSCLKWAEENGKTELVDLMKQKIKGETQT